MIYDGVCNLCTSAIRILHALDRYCRLEYVPSQQLSEDVRFQLGLSEEQLEGQMHVVSSDGSVASGPAAIAEICRLLGAPIRYAPRLLLTPQARQLYYWMARRRYRLFGCRSTCYTITRKVRVA